MKKYFTTRSFIPKRSKLYHYQNQSVMEDFVFEVKARPVQTQVLLLPEPMSWKVKGRSLFVMSFVSVTVTSSSASLAGFFLHFTNVGYPPVFNKRRAANRFFLSALLNSTQLNITDPSQHCHPVFSNKTPNNNLPESSTYNTSTQSSSKMASPQSKDPTPPSTPRTNCAPPNEAPQTPDATVLSLQTKLSFCLPTSLAFFHHLTWNQTPWTTRSLPTKSISPICASDAHTIAHHLDVSAESIQNALYFGGHPTGPSLYVIFPHATTRVSTNERFLTIWHDQVVKPAFDRAWRDSGLVDVHGADVDGQTRILPPTGTRTNKDALPARGFMERLRHGRQGSVSVN
jgi:hypothetical protein